MSRTVYRPGRSQNQCSHGRRGEYCMPMRALSSRLVRVAVCVVLGVTAVKVHAQNSVAFDLPEQPLAEALIAVANRTDTNIYVDKRLVGERIARALRGNLSAEEAVAKLL